MGFLTVAFPTAGNSAAQIQDIFTMSNKGKLFPHSHPNLHHPKHANRCLSKGIMFTENFTKITKITHATDTTKISLQHITEDKSSMFDGTY